MLPSNSHILTALTINTVMQLGYLTIYARFP